MELHGYPLNKQPQAIETPIKQTELLAENKRKNKAAENPMRGIKTAIVPNANSMLTRYARNMDIGRQEDPPGGIINKNPMNLSASKFIQVMLRIILASAIATTCPTPSDASEMNSFDSGKAQKSIIDTKKQNLNIFSLQTSLPFGWLDNVYSGYSFLDFGYSRFIPIDDARKFGIVPGVDFVLLQGARYNAKYGLQSDEEIYTTFPIHINLSARYNCRHASGITGITLCVPIGNFDPLSTKHAKTGIPASFWQSHYGINYKLSNYFELGIRTNIAFTKFHAEDGYGYDNNIVLSGSILF